MFRIGEFSKIAQVSGRLLRYYDQIGLFKPEHIDKASGYRLYSARQLPDLNRILALKELGLTLEQIAPLVKGAVSQDELRAMLTLKKSQIAQSLQEEYNRFQYIESRIQQIDQEGAMADYDIVIKSVPAQPFLSLRKICYSAEASFFLLEEMRRILPGRVSKEALGYFTVVVHSGWFELDNLDLEAGFTVSGNVSDNIPLSDGQALTLGELPAVETMATVARVGNPVHGFGSYSMLGTWIEANGYRFSGLGREVFLELPHPDRLDDTVAEIQFPVEKRAAQNLLPT
ncbi:MAG: MerR family transcriptional regulator [Anaerolineae bacterium]|nr:MerR family transcriptional regulator [Anaerolineae bacterium]